MMSKVSCFVARRPYSFRRRRSGCQRGFTLVELLIVVSIIVILISMIGLVFPGFQKKLNVTKCQKNLRAIHGILMQYAAANDGWFPTFNDYYGFDNSFPSQLKGINASPDIFCCPFYPGYGDPDYYDPDYYSPPYPPPEGRNIWKIWEDPDAPYLRLGYYFIINRGGRYGMVNLYADGRMPIRKDSAGEDNLPIVADILHYRDQDIKSGWYHGGSLNPNADVPKAGEGLYNSSCNTLFFGGYVIFKTWLELEEQNDIGGHGTRSSSNDLWWFWLGHETDEY